MIVESSKDLRLLAKLIDSYLVDSRLFVGVMCPSQKDDFLRYNEMKKQIEKELEIIEGE